MGGKAVWKKILFSIIRQTGSLSWSRYMNKTSLNLMSVPVKMATRSVYSLGDAISVMACSRM